MSAVGGGVSVDLTKVEDPGHYRADGGGFGFMRIGDKGDRVDATVVWPVSPAGADALARHIGRLTEALSDLEAILAEGGPTR